MCPMRTEMKPNARVGSWLVCVGTVVFAVALTMSAAARSSATDEMPLAEAYCKAIKNDAREARYKHQLDELRGLSAQIDRKLGELNTAAAQLEAWLKERRSFVQRATSRLVEIFSSMRSDAASGQIARLDDATASAIVLELEPRAAAGILSEMPPERAARLAAIIAGAANFKKSQEN